MLGQLAPGTTIAGYEILRSLGRGGMGDVYLARREGETRSVALKLLSAGLISDTRFRDRFVRESHMATSLEHPHIVPVYATGEVEGVRYIAMRYVDGPTLRDLIDEESPLDCRRTLSLLAQVASALDDAHGIGLVHRDIKPGNVLIARSGASEFREHAYLTDFGVSKYTGSESDFTRTGQFVGTSLYAAPEQIQGESIDGRTDVYAFGGLLFECLTGRPPFSKESEPALLWAQMFEKPPSASALRSDLPEEIDSVIAKALAKAPTERYATCGEVVAAAREALAKAEPALARSSPPAAGATAIKPFPELEPEPVPELEPEPEHELEPEPEPEPAGATAIKPVEEIVPLPPAGATVIKPATEEVEAPSVMVADAESGDGAVIADPSPDTDVGARRAEAAVEPAETRRLEPQPEHEPEPEPQSEPEQEPAPAIAVAPATVVTADDRGRESIEASAAPSAVHPPPPPIGLPSPAAPRRLVDARRGRLVAAGAGLVLLVVAALAAFALLGDDETSPPSSLSPPMIAGVARTGVTLTARRGRWANSPNEFAYQWRLCKSRGAGCRAVTGGTSVKYVVRPSDVGRRIRVAVTASNAEGTRTSVSAATRAVAPAPSRPVNVKPPTISGTPQEGQRLVALPGSWTGTGRITYAYVWRRCSSGECTTIGGARRSTYTLRSADVGSTIRVDVRASNGVGRTVMSSMPTAVVQPEPPPTIETTTTTTTTTTPTTTTTTTVTEPIDP